MQLPTTTSSRRLTRRAFITGSAGALGVALLGLRARGSSADEAQARLVRPDSVHGGDTRGCQCPICQPRLPEDAQMA